MLLLFTMLLFAVIWTLLLCNSNRYVSVVLLLSYAGITYYFKIINGITFLMFVIGISLCLIVWSITKVRRTFLTKHIFKWFKSIMPPMSETEKEAIASGDTWYEADLFAGKMNWDKFLQVPLAKLNSEENDFLNNQVTTLCNMLDDWQITNESYDLPKEVWAYMRKERFFSLLVPKKYGGLDFSAVANSTIVAKIATKSLTAAVTVMVPNSLGPGELLMNYGTDEQKTKYLPDLASGKHIPCFALTGVEAGSDAGSIPDYGIVCYGDFEGNKNVLGISLTWNKRYITLAPVATLLGLAVKLQDPDNLLTKKASGITVVLLPTSIPGVNVGRRHFPLNQTFMNGPTNGKDVFVPLDYIIGGQDMIGKGWTMLVECLAAGRGVSLPALSTALGKMCMRTTGSYAKIRKQFHMSIGHFEGVQEAMARIGGYTYMLEATRLLTLTALDLGKKPSVITAIAKYHMTEMGRQIINDAMDIHGGRGIMLGRANYLARAYQGMPVSITVEGANILTRSLMIFGQGAIRCHPYVADELLSVSHPDPKVSLIAFDTALMKHIKYTSHNIARMLLHSITGGLLLRLRTFKYGKLNSYIARLDYYSLVLSVLADLSMLIMGGSLKRRESQSARLGDILSNLYLSSAVIKYYYEHKNSVTNSTEELSFVEWALANTTSKMDIALNDFMQNFKPKIFGCILKLLVNLFGIRSSKPKDYLFAKISDVMMSQSAFKDRITQDCAFELNSKDPVGKMELALNKIIEIEPILIKIKQAQKEGKISKNLIGAKLIAACSETKVLTDAELSELEVFEHLRVDAIMVDDFDSATFSRK